MKPSFIVLTLFAFLIASCANSELEKELVKETFDDGTPKVVWYYSGDDTTDVRAVVYHHNKTKSIEGRLKNGKREGEWNAWNENGVLITKGNYKEGIDHGKKTVYFENGNKYYQGKYKNGKRAGKWTFWTQEGKEVKKINYSDEP